MPASPPGQVLDRRGFLQTSLLAAAAAPLAAQADDAAAPKSSEAQLPGLIDTNVHLFDWPFRELKYHTTPALMEKLKRHRVSEAWAGSFQAVLHKNLDGVNRRLTEECRTLPRFLRPVGSVCPAWPGWEEDLRRCHEVYGMHAVRLYPAYHQYRFDLPELAALLEDAARRHLIVQISLDLEDPRVHHPALNLAPIDITPLAGVLRRVPTARVQLLNGQTALQQGGTRELLADTQVRFDIANLEGTGAVGRLIDGRHWSIKAQVPLVRLLFGSHAPYFPFEAALLRLFESPLTRDQMLALMSGNATTWQEQRGS